MTGYTTRYDRLLQECMQVTDQAGGPALLSFKCNVSELNLQNASKFAAMYIVLVNTQ